jgi:hypothetical protein
MNRTAAKTAHRNGNGARSLRLDPRNARVHGEENKKLIRRSLEEVGPFRSIGVDGEGIIRAGNGVYEQAQALGLKVRIVDARPSELIAVRRRDLKGRKAVRAALLDNRTGELSEWNPDQLTEYHGLGLLKGLDLDDFIKGNGKPLAATDTLLDQAVQLRPPREYVLVICADDDGAEFAELRKKLDLKEVRRGGYKRGSQFDDVGVQRVVHARDLLKRLR